MSSDFHIIDGNNEGILVLQPPSHHEMLGVVDRAIEAFDREGKAEALTGP